jgi:Spy/CpxP family protein refolding chaperone
MLTSNKKRFGGIAAAIVILLVSLTLLAQNQPKNNATSNSYGSSYWNANIPEKYWLSDDQINQVNKIKTEYDDLIQPEIEKLNSVRGDYSDYRQQDDISSKRISEYQSQMRGIEENIYSLRMEAESKIRKVFTNNQKVYYNDSRSGWRDGFYERCSWDYADMDYGMKNHSQRNGFPVSDYGMKRYGRVYNSGRCW